MSQDVELIRRSICRRPHGSSVRLEESIFHLWTIRDGCAVRAEMFRAEANALESASRPVDRA